MKTFIFIIVATLFTNVYSFAQESYTKDATQLPAPARTFIDRHFPGQGISYIMIDKEMTNTEYEVVLTNHQEITFNKNGEWKEIDGKRNPLPKSVIPNEASSYLQSNFRDTGVKEIERKFWGYEINLMNGLEIKLDSQGRLLEIDD